MTQSYTDQELRAMLLTAFPAPGEDESGDWERVLQLTADGRRPLRAFATPRTVAKARRRRIAARVAIVAAAAVAAIIAVLAAPQGRSGITGQALAAIGDGPIMHVVTEFRSGTVSINLKTGKRTVQVMREELWADRQLNRFHLVLSVNGHRLGDLLYPRDAKNGASVPTPNPAFVALWTGYRTALKNGTAMLAGRGTVRGHAVYWLRFKQTAQYPARVEVAVDAHTYKPILERSYENGTHFDQRILVAKAIAYHPAEFKRRGPSLATSGASAGGSSTGTVSPSAPPATVVVRAPWLTAGKTAAGLKLRAANPLIETTSVAGKQKSIHGLELVYGPLSHGATTPFSTTIDELLRPDNPRLWRNIPADSIQINTGEESSTQGGTHRLWTGYLRKDGVYITITTTKGRQALLQIARSLHRSSR